MGQKKGFRGGLTAVQSDFVNAMVSSKDMNATEAYQVARPKCSRRTAGVNSTRLMQNPKVKAAIQAAIDERAERTKITADMVIQELAKIGFADIRKIYDEHGNLLPVHMLPDREAAAVSSISVVTRQIPGSKPVEVEHTASILMNQKVQALNLLGKHTNAFPTEPATPVNLTLTLSYAEQLQLARERQKKRKRAAKSAGA